MFLYNSTHKIVICDVCRSSIIPGTKSQQRHLRERPHQLLGDTLATTLQLLSSYELRSAEELKAHKPGPDDQCQLIEYLQSFDSFCYLYPDCGHCTINNQKIREHVSKAHKAKAKDHKISALWKHCKLQTYFTAKGLIDYFVVVDTSIREHRSITSVKVLATPLLPTEGEKAYFKEVEADYNRIKDEIAEQAGIVHDFEDSRSSRQPWLEKTAFPSHLAGLLDEEIHTSYTLPSAKELEGGGSGRDPETDLVLVCLVNATRSFLQDAYKLCSNNSPDRKITQQRANILNEFYAGASGKSASFRPYKLGSTLAAYFRTWMQLVVYYYRVVYQPDSHFARSSVA
jgi:hypothetical protein